MTEIKGLPAGKYVVEIESATKKVKTNEGNIDVSISKGGDSAHFLELRYRVLEGIHNGWAHTERLYLWHDTDFVKKKSRDKLEKLCSTLGINYKQEALLNKLKGEVLAITITHDKGKDEKIWVNVKRYEDASVPSQQKLAIEDDELPI